MSETNGEDGEAVVSSGGSRGGEAKAEAATHLGLEGETFDDDVDSRVSLAVAVVFKEIITGGFFDLSIVGDVFRFIETI